MNYEDRYNEALKIARDNYNAADSANINVNSFKNTLTTIFPELKESDEKIRQFLIHEVTETSDEIMSYRNMNKKDVLNWLEKQESVGEIVERCKDSWYNEGKIQGKIEGLSDDEKYQQGWHDALEKQGGQKPVWSEEDERILKTIVINIENLQFSEEMREKYHRIPSLNKNYYQIMADWLKSIKDRIQSKQSNKIQGKTALEANKEGKVGNTNNIDLPLKIGDWIVMKDGGDFHDGRKFAKIVNIDDEGRYWLDCGTWLRPNEIRRWSIADAEDGDVIVDGYNNIGIYKGYKGIEGIYEDWDSYIYLGCDGKLRFSNGRHDQTDTHPATKEQRETLERAIINDGYRWDTDKKELVSHYKCEVNKDSRKELQQIR